MGVSMGSLVKVALLLPWLAAVGGAVGCDGPEPADGDADVDADADADADSGPAEVIEDLPIAAEVPLRGLSAPVDAVRDDRGFWHVYAASEADAYVAEGYLMAHDRMGQMHFFRMGASGRTAEYAGSMMPELLDDDADARFEGHLRNAVAIAETLSGDELVPLEAFSSGVNAFIGELQAGTKQLPRAVPVPPASLYEWTPIDSLAIARLEAASLSWDAYDDVDRTTALASYLEAFPEESPDPAVAARSRGFHDLWSFEPVEPVFVRDGFPNVGDDTGSRAHRPPPFAPGTVAAKLPPIGSLRAARSALERIELRHRRLFGDEFRGSNNWVVHGSKTATRNPMLASDPHLALTSPPLFWHVHLNTSRAGGALDAAGLSLVGAPGLLLGFNDQIAWGLTTHSFDVTDVYLETVTPGTSGRPSTVTFDGGQVPIEEVTEVILDDRGVEHEVIFERVPHHGLIIPGSRTETSALSIRWTGDEPSNEVGAFVGLMRARNVAEARDAIEGFEVGGQNFVLLTRGGDIFWSTQVRLPTRDARALTYDPASHEGFSPCHVLSGTGEHEWTGRVSDRYLPHDLNPERGYIATANGDAVGVTADGNPFDAEVYVGCDFDQGYRIARIVERLDALAARSSVTRGDMQTIQNDAVSPLGRALTAPLVAELDRLEEALSGPEAHPDLAGAIGEADAAELDLLVAMRDRLRDWRSFDTPAAVEGRPTDGQIADSVATTIFNVTVGRLMELAFGDELDRVGMRPQSAIRTLRWALTEPERLRTFDAGLGDTLLWDDLATPGVVESRGDRVVRAFLSTLRFLLERLGEDMDDWRWGALHTLTLVNAFIPAIGAETIQIPLPGDERFPNGFPRHGDRFTVDVANFSVWATDGFSYGSGPQQRFVLEMTGEGPRAWTALPGGQVLDPEDPHHADEIEHWRRNSHQPVYFAEPDVVAHAELRYRLTPGS